MVIKRMMVLLVRTISLSRLDEKVNRFIWLMTYLPKVTQKLIS